MVISKSNNLNSVFQQYLDYPCHERLDAVAEAGRPLVIHFASLYGSGCPFDDIYQTGMLGLVKAVKTYDGSTLFTTWASNCIIGEIRHFVRKERNYHYPDCIGQLQQQADLLIETAVKTDGPPPDTGALAQKLGVSREGYREVMRAGLVSFNEIDVSKISSAQAQSFHLPIEDKIALDQAIGRLSEIQKHVVHALYYRGLTQQQTAEELGINQRKVSRIKTGVIRLLGEMLNEPNFRLIDSSRSFVPINKKSKK
ncbi:MAG TPA: sigma-70 family RNA polymerase sigma factor [Clostridia bacterium]|nr:sigma-70 family RNA polymerase sigma factor [Clostridia bacterium]